MADEQQQDAGQNNGQQQDGQQADQQAQASATQTFDQWIAAQSDTVKDLLDDHTTGLKSALDDERRARKGLAAQIKDLSKQADSGSDLQKQLETLTGQMTEADTKAAFFEAAHEAGVKNLRLAYMAAREYDLFGRNGAVDFSALKAAAPELFANKLGVAAVNGGSGANQQGAVVPNMNQAIRAMAGRG